MRRFAAFLLAVMVLLSVVTVSSSDELASAAEAVIDTSFEELEGIGYGAAAVETDAVFENAVPVESVWTVMPVMDAAPAVEEIEAASDGLVAATEEITENAAPVVDAAAVDTVIAGAVKPALRVSVRVLNAGDIRELDSVTLMASVEGTRADGVFWFRMRMDLPEEERVWEEIGEGETLNLTASLSMNSMLFTAVACLEGFDSVMADPMTITVYPREVADETVQPVEEIPVQPQAASVPAVRPDMIEYPDLGVTDVQTAGAAEAVEPLEDVQTEEAAREEIEQIQMMAVTYTLPQAEEEVVPVEIEQEPVEVTEVENITALLYGAASEEIPEAEIEEIPETEIMAAMQMQAALDTEDELEELKAEETENPQAAVEDDQAKAQSDDDRTEMQLVSTIGGIINISDDLDEILDVPDVLAARFYDIQVSITSSRREVIRKGETIYLTGVVKGADGLDLHYQWECNRGDGFEKVENGNESVYSFTADAQSLSWTWRLIVTCF